MKKPSAVQVEYWEAKLKRYGLTMEAGRTNWMDYGHKEADKGFEGQTAYKPTGESTEREWPQSMC
jgi:hypothetical protein